MKNDEYAFWPILVLVALALGVAQAAPQPQPQLPEGPLAFVIDLDTTGGFSGRGLGGVTVDSNGSVGASRVGGSARAAPECRAKLGADDLQSLRRAVESARLQTWPESFAPAGDDGCCDRFRWTLRVGAAARRRSGAEGVDVVVRRERGSPAEGSGGDQGNRPACAQTGAGRLRALEPRRSEAKPRQC